jgi:predicted nucleotide-binding protein
MSKPYLFVAYAREDSRLVEPIVRGLNQIGIDTWIDIKDLQPGQNWRVAIRDALEGATGMLVFVSRASMKSEYIRREVEAAARGTKYLIIPVILEHTADLPGALQVRQWLDLTGKMDVAKAVAAIEHSVQHTSTRTPETLRRISADEAQEVATQVADEVRGGKVEEAAAPDAVFLVHGRDLLLLDEVVSYLEAQGVRTVVLTKIGGAEKSLFQKFLKWGGEARFAIVLFSADDLGAARLQYEHVGVGEKALQFRARQNVLLELGFFYGRLGWENVFALYKPANEVFPNFELPSDLGGVVFDEVDPKGNWKALLTDRLLKAGFELRERKGSA